MKREDNSKKIAFIILIILLVIVLIVGLFFNYSNKLTTLPIKSEIKNESPIKDIEISEDYTKVMDSFNIDLDKLNLNVKKTSGRTITFYKDDIDYFEEITLDKGENYKDYMYDQREGYYTLNCISNTCQVLSRTDTGIFLIHDKDYYLIDVANKKYRTIEGIDASKYYPVLINGCISYKDKMQYSCEKGLLYGILLNAITEDDNDIFYNLLFEKTTINIPNSEIFDYTDDYFLNRGLIEVSNSNTGVTSLYDFATGSERNGTGIVGGGYSVEDSTIPYISYYGKEGTHSNIAIVDKQLNRVFKDDKEFDNVKFVKDTKHIYLFNNMEKEYYKYDFDKNNLSSSRTVYEIVDIIEDTDKNDIYEIVLINDILNIVKDNKVIYNTKINYNNVTYYDRYSSAYYKEDEGTQKGIYLIYSEDRLDYMQKELYYNLDTGEANVKKMPMLVYDKPVIYLYPEKETDVKVSFAKPSEITTSYPKFNSVWEVKSYPDGSLYDKDGKYYYALYFEENGNHTVNFDEGFYVTKDNAIEFLEEKLSIIGLNNKERNEMIMYWLPILETNEKSLVYFELTEERNKYNELFIYPKPDSVLRISMHVKKVDKEYVIKEQELPTFKRKGFTVVEWGGINE